ncbi:MAG: DUF378 domain-containing protein [Alphaproteobacteria bacterium]|nr:DUF378 domain-containing protein [Alphaproteobacteria bacterium]
MNMNMAVKVLTIIGALNWGLVAVGHFSGNSLNVVDALLGSSSTIANIVYLVVGIAGVVYVVNFKKIK